MEHIKTIIVGGGQAGLSASYYLKQENEEHLILEQASGPAYPWRNERWDSFTLVTPRFAFNIPGGEYKGPEPDSFMPRAEVVQFFENYIRRFNLPIQFNTKVLSIKLLKDHRYIIETTGRNYIADNVIISTGFFQRPKIPRRMVVPPDIKLIHSSEYKNPDALPPGAVLVAGSAQSGCQIAEELNLNGRKVFLCIGRAGRVPRRYRGRDIIGWLDTIGFFDITPDQLPPGAGKYDGIPHISGTRGGHTINLHQFARDGITLLGHLHEIADGTAYIANDLYTNLKIADQLETQVVNAVDSFIASKGLKMPAEELPQITDGFEQPIIERIDLKKSGISTIINAMGFTFDYSIVKLPVVDPDGFPIQNRGVTKYSGLYFAGIPWMPSERSGFLVGVGDSVKYIISNILSKKKERVDVV